MSNSPKAEASRKSQGDNLSEILRDILIVQLASEAVPQSDI